MMKIGTERLVLKKPEHKDKSLLVAQIGDWQVAKWLSRVPYPYTQQDADDWLQIISQQELTFNIFENDSLVGGVALTPQENEYYELGYWLGKQHWGQGFATEAGRGLLHYAVAGLDLKNFKSSYMQGNAASARVLKKLGFKKTGEGEMYCLARKATLPCINLLFA